MFVDWSSIKFLNEVFLKSTPDSSTETSGPRHLSKIFYNYVKWTSTPR